MAVVVAVDVRPPLPECAGFGQLRSRVLDALVLDLPAEVPGALHAELLAWAGEQLEGVRGLARGVRFAGVPWAWIETLGWSGVPLAAAGDLVWGVDLDEAEVELPQVKGERLLLPPVNHLAELSGLAMKPLRAWVGQRLACRLQASPGLRLYLWGDRALVVSHLDVPVGGFLYGPAAGTRASLALAAGGFQLITW